MAQETDDAIIPWIQGFIEHHGIASVQWLLEEVGEVPAVSPVRTGSIGKTELAEESLVALSATLQQPKDTKTTTKAVRWLPTDQPMHTMKLLPLETNKTKAPLVLAEGVMSVEGDDEIAPPDKIDWDKAFP